MVKGRGQQASEKTWNINRALSELRGLDELPSGFLEGSVYKDILYHGSNRKRVNLSPEGSSEYGIFLSPNHRYARRYGSVLHRVLVNIKNPIIVEWKGDLSPKDLTRRDIQNLKSQGYDGIVVTSGALNQADEIIAFNSDQVFVLSWS